MSLLIAVVAIAPEDKTPILERLKANQ